MNGMKKEREIAFSYDNDWIKKKLCQRKNKTKVLTIQSHIFAQNWDKYKIRNNFQWPGSQWKTYIDFITECNWRNPDQFDGKKNLLLFFFHSSRNSVAAIPDEVMKESSTSSVIIIMYNRFRLSCELILTINFNQHITEQLPSLQMRPLIIVRDLNQSI